MGKEINLLNNYPRTKRPIEERAQLVTEQHRAVAREFGREYFDGDRLHGYNGYNYHPRFWQATVKRIRDHYGLAADARILDVGCAKGFMLHDFQELMPLATLAGIDVSEYAIANAKESVAPFLRVGDARAIPYENGYFDLVISINTVHNLKVEDCKNALHEIQRVSKSHSFIVVDAWRNEEEQKNLLMWNLTAQTFMHADDWKGVFAEVGYTGDYYWFIAE